MLFGLDYVKLPRHALRLDIDPLLLLDRIVGSENLNHNSFLNSMESQLETGAEADVLHAVQHARPQLRPTVKSERNKSRLSCLPDHDSWNSDGEGITSFAVKQLNTLNAQIVLNDIHQLAFIGPENVQAQMTKTMSITTRIIFCTQ